MTENPSKPPKYLNQSWYIILFIFLLSLFTGGLLSTVYYVLSPYQQQAARFDQNKQMLGAAHLINEYDSFQVLNNGEWVPAIYNKTLNVLQPATKSNKASSSAVDQYCQYFVRPLLADRKGRMFSFEEKNIDYPSFLERNKNKHLYLQPFLLFYAILENTESAKSLSAAEVINNPSSIQALVIPISGFGLWGPIYGYLGVQNDGNTVLGATWYQQGETPGLGANIANYQWQSLFYGKKLFLPSASGTTDWETAPLGIEVIKGSVPAILGDSPKANSSVDGISGATLTCHGVTDAYAQSLAPYRQLLIYFANLNSSGEERVSK